MVGGGGDWGRGEFSHGISRDFCFRRVYIIEGLCR